MNDLIKLITLIAKNVGIAFLLLLFAAFVSRGESKAEKEAKRLGFSGTSEMEKVHSLGWHTKTQYIADETARAKRLGFKDIDELHEADSAGAANKQEYTNYLREKDRAAQAQADDRGRGSSNQANYENNSNFTIGCYSYNDLNNSTGLWCSGSKFALTIEKYKEICARVNAISASPIFLSWTGATSYDDNAAALLRSGGTIRSIKSSWAQSEDGLQGGCKISVSVSGVYEGTSTRGIAVTFADGFRVDEEGDVIAISGPSGLVWLR